ncbi:MAG: hypothetical protein CVU14_04290 [Bacteroidetes bacterium HGW-Bacteroidetes-9]|nr:MAG: hypothetical protein CVU14_04290 [Bacteroidetes bacterium HGW-Bacteroidetes-9]
MLIKLQISLKALRKYTNIYKTVSTARLLFTESFELSIYRINNQFDGFTDLLNIPEPNIWK